MSGLIQPYFTPDWRQRVIDCACGWQGASADMVMDLQEEVTDFACPRCESLLLIIPHPSLDEVRQAAADGHEEASQQLAIIEEAFGKPTASD